MNRPTKQHGSAPPRLDAYLTVADLRRSLADDARHGLTAAPKDLPPKWFYDAAGSDLFDQITRLEEYYPTEAERGILQDSADEIVRLAGADTIVELGSGSSDKTRLLLDAMRAAGTLRRYIPFDVSESALTAAMAHIAATYDGLEVHGIVGDFDRHLSHIPRGGRRLIAFLGGTIGNYEPRSG